MENTRLVYLLNGFFANTGTPIEKEELMLLLDSNQHDEAVKAYIDQAWDKSDPPHQLTDQQSTSILSAVFSTTKGRLIPIQSGSGYKKWVWAAAAVLVIALSSTAWFLFPGSSTRQNSIASASHPSGANKNDVAPGSNGAILTLADGSVIVLDSAEEGRLANQGNTSILKSGGSLQYISQAGTGGGPLAYNTIATPRSRQFQLVLEDGTKVWLNAESSIRFPTTFDKKERRVEITGEAYFEVAKNAAKPFTVSVNGMQVQVLGTHFNINSYSDESAIHTTLLEGSVRVIKDKEAKMLIPGQQAQLGNNGSFNVVKNVNTSEIVAWKNELFSFHDTDLKNLMRQVARWYDVEIVMPENIGPTTFNGNISRRSNLSDVLKMLELTDEVSFSIEGKKVIVHM
ncbi:MAG: FecR domain-containing protein [Ferruginibacter sp.]